MPPITWIGSPNFTQGREGNSVAGFIIHWMDGTLASTDNVFQDRARNTSAHYGVEDGTIHQYVKDSDTAYQAGNWDVNLSTIGIEHSAQPGRNASDATYESSAQLIASIIKSEAAGNSLRPHNAIIATECPGTVDVNRIQARVNAILSDANAPVVQNITVTDTPAGATATVTVPALYVRSHPNPTASLAGTQVLHQGDTFQYQGVVQGTSVSGVSTWLHSTKGNYVWAGGTNYLTTPAVSNATGGTAEAVRVAYVREAPNTSAALGGSQVLQPGNTFQYSAEVVGQNVSQNGITSNLWYHSTVGNYVWSGNCKKI